MVLGFNNHSLIIGLGLAALILKPAQLEYCAYAAGKALGKAMGFIYHVRGNLMKEENSTYELLKIHREIKDSMNELHKIRNEIRMGTRVFQTDTYIMNEHSPTTSHNNNIDKSKENDIKMNKNNNEELINALMSKVNGTDKKEKSMLQQYPISALSLGLIEERNPEKTTVSDIAYDIYLEEQVAKNAHALMSHDDKIPLTKNNSIEN